MWLVNVFTWYLYGCLWEYVGVYIHICVVRGRWARLSTGPLRNFEFVWAYSTSCKTYIIPRVSNSSKLALNVPVALDLFVVLVIEIDLSSMCNYQCLDVKAMAERPVPVIRYNMIIITYIIYIISRCNQLSISVKRLISYIITRISITINISIVFKFRFVRRQFKV